MASWSENSSYQGAASGAAAGSIGGVYGAAAGAVIGFVAGGMMGGAQEDAAKAAENARLKEIQRAIEMQNTKEFKAKAQAEEFAMADIGINKGDQMQDAIADTAGLKKRAKEADALTSKHMNFYGNAAGKGKVTEANWEANKKQYATWAGKRNLEYINKVENARLGSKVAHGAVAANEGILANYEKDMAAAPKKY